VDVIGALALAGRRIQDGPGWLAERAGHANGILLLCNDLGGTGRRGTPMDV